VPGGVPLPPVVLDLVVEVHFSVVRDLEVVHLFGDFEGLVVVLPVHVVLLGAHCRSQFLFAPRDHALQFDVIVLLVCAAVHLYRIIEGCLALEALLQVLGVLNRDRVLPAEVPRQLVLLVVLEFVPLTLRVAEGFVARFFLYLVQYPLFL